MSAGEKLFAERGISTVSLREINAAAGQRNTSALHYHFGSRDGLLQAILAPHLARLRARRAAMLEARSNEGKLTLSAASEVIVLPHVELLDRGESAAAFVQIARWLVIDPTFPSSDVIDLLDEAAIRDALDAIRAELDWMGPLIAEARIRVALMMLIHAVADQAHLAGTADRSALGDVDDVAALLLDMFMGALRGGGSE